MSRHKRSHDEHENHERWLVSYADFITLLFAFFTVLYATSERNVKKQKEFESSVRQSFQAFIPNGDPSGPGEYTSYNHGGSVVQQPLEMFQHRTTNTSFEDELRLELQRRLGKEKFDRLVTTRAESNGVRIAFVSSEFFSDNSSKLAARALDSLQSISEVLNRTGKKIVVEGHMNTSRTEGRNTWEMSSARATTLVRYFQAKGISPDRLSAVAYADGRANGDNRIELVVQTDP